MRRPWGAALLAGAALGLGLVSCSDQSPSEPHPTPCPPDSERVVVAQDWQPAWSPDGRTIAYQHESFHEEPRGVSGIYVVRVDPDSVSRPERVTRPKSMVYWLRFAPDGRRLAYWWGNIFVVDVETREEIQVTEGGQLQMGDWHPDGRHILYVVSDGSPPDSGGLRVVDIVTLQRRALLMADGRPLGGGGMRWDRAGASFVYTRTDHGTHGLEVFRVWPDFSKEIRLTHRGWECENPAWFPNGREVIFRISGSGPPNPPYLSWWVVDVDGSEPKQFLDGKVRIGPTCALSPDGTGVVFSRLSNCGTYLALWIVRFQGDEILEERQITGLPERSGTESTELVEQY